MPDTQRVSQAQQIIQEILTLPVNVNDRTLTALLGNVKIQLVAQVLQQLQAAAVPISNFAIEAPTLDDVFLKLTVGKN